MTTRTLWNWERRPEGTGRPPGRPSHGEPARQAALWAVAREYRRQGRGRVGWRPIAAGLGEGVPVRLVQESLAAIKLVGRRMERERRERERVHVEVRGREVLWSLDGAHLDRDGDRKAVKTEVVKDVGTTAISSAALGAAAGSAEVAALLESTAARRGWPMVLSTDNGPENIGREVSETLERNRVVHLRSLPHTPQHNGWIEHGIGELKEVCWQDALRREEADPSSRPALFGEDWREKAIAIPRLGQETRGNAAKRASRAIHLAVWQDRLDRAIRRIVTHRRRATRGYQTAEALDAIRPRGEDLVDRERFYKAACSARSRAVVGLEGDRERRRAEREAILTTMERFGLITRTRGGVPIPAPEPESVS